jgi:hypothetical protein
VYQLPGNGPVSLCLSSKGEQEEVGRQGLATKEEVGRQGSATKEGTSSEALAPKRFNPMGTSYTYSRQLTNSEWRKPKELKRKSQFGERKA